MSKADDDCWNTSNVSGFNFDDDDDSLDQTSQDFIFQSLEESFDLPIHLLVSKASMDIILENDKSTLLTPVSSVGETIKKMVHGHTYTLQHYVKFQDKMKLLDLALDSCDANVIIKVIIYLKTTLKRNIFYHQLSKRKIGVKHYAHYLITKNLLEELSDFYMATGNSNLMVYIFYLTAHGLVNKSQIQKRIQQFTVQHLQEVNSNVKQEISDFLQMINYQIENQCSTSSVINQLVDLCRIQLERHQNMDEILSFKKNFKIDDFTFDWTLVNVLCTMKLWNQIKDYFLKTNWLTKRNVLKSSISSEAFLDILHKHDTPKEILESVLACISDHDKAVFLASLYKCHNFVIQYYIQQKDRQSLFNYKEKVLPHTPEYYLIESSLQSMEKKRRN
ncbi:hypothetical protein GWI33_001395 [Rhynchophorus ferrugineus]|uniref:Vps16 C-terminal domain-containing protein n=1 Tax=Rhynchophorus ferrugineus TaxID=354439 RepID=A0A834IXZ6_RHYFE|nr:hypothetical protein GWI33_001395 [Rhynchophorus ferrugineus]